MMQSSETRRKIWARWGLDPHAGLIDGLLIESASGKFIQVSSCPKPPSNLPDDCVFPKGLATPGLLNAHAHLDYSWLEGRLPRGSFIEWLLKLIAEKNSVTDKSTATVREACARAIQQAIATGTTALWDIATLGVARPLLDSSSLASISFMEIIAPSRADWESDGRARLAQYKMASYITAPDGGFSLSVSPHTAFTVIPEALEACAHWANRRGAPLAIHLAESPEENRMLLEGAGPLFEMFNAMSPGRFADEIGIGQSPIERALRAGALQPHCLAIHCNLPQPGEAQILARSETAVVFCPLSHAFFDYPPYPLGEYRKAGVRLALGTDSLASNNQLDIRLEAAEIARRYPPEDLLWILALATGAALNHQAPFGGRGLFGANLRADWAIWEPSGFPSRPNTDNMMQCWLDPATRCVASSCMSATLSSGAGKP